MLGLPKLRNVLPYRKKIKIKVPSGRVVLNESEKQYRTLVASAHEGIVMTDKNDVLTYVNERFAKSLGYTSAQLVGKNVRELATKESVKRIEKETIKRIEGKKSTYEITMFHKNRTKKHFSVSVSPIFDSSNSYVGAFGVFANITDLTNTKRQLEHRLNFQKNVSLCVTKLANITVNNLDQKMQEVLKGLLKQTSACKAYIFENNFDADGDLCMKKRFEVFDSEKCDESLDDLTFKYKDFSSNLFKTLSAGRYYTEFKEKKRNTIAHYLCGKEKVKSFLILPIFSKKKLWGFIGFNHSRPYKWHHSDIHFFETIASSIGSTIDRIESEKMHHASEVRYRELFNNISNGISVFEAKNNGKDFIFKRINKAGEKINKMLKKDILGKSITEVFPNIKKHRLYSALKRVWKTGQPEFIPPWHYTDKRISGWRESYVYKLPTGEIVSSYADVSKRKNAEEALKESESRYRSIIDQSIMGVALVQGETIIFANKQLAKMGGYTKASEMTGKNIREFLAPTSYQKASKLLKLLIGGRNVPELDEYEAVKKNGKKIYIQTFTKYISIRGVKTVQTFVTDITEKKMMEMRLNKRIKQINLLYKVYSHTKLMVPASEVLSNLVGDLMSLLPDNPYVKAKILFDDKVYQCPKNNKKFVSKIEEPLVIRGVKRGVLKVGYTKSSSQNEDITKLKDEKKLICNIAKIVNKYFYSREIIERHRQIITRSFTALLIFQGNRIRYANPRFFKMFKCKEEQALGVPVKAFLINCPTNKNIDGKVREYKARRCDGAVIDVALTMQNINYHGSSAVLLRINDITALKQAETRLKNFNISLRKIVAEKTRHLEEANKRLQSLNELKDEFIAVTSHELRSPLTSIRGYLSFLVEDESLDQIPAELRQYLMRAYSTTESLNYLINNVLDVSRLEMGRLELHPAKTDLLHLVKGIVESLSFQANEKKLTINFENQTGCKELPLKIDSIRISQVLRNILDNSIKFTKRDKQIDVSISKSEKYVTLNINDEGVGIPKAKLKHIFDKFVQIRNISTRYKGGVGLGLFIVKKIVELHGGKIEARKNKKGGTTMIVRLPLK